MDRYPVILERDGKTLSVSFPDVPIAHTFGEGEEDALAHAADALSSAFGLMMADKEDIPRASPARGRPTVSVSPIDAMKIEIYRAMRKQGITKAALARRLKWHPPQIDRLLDLRHESKLNQIEQALAAVGKVLVVSVKDAA